MFPNLRSGAASAGRVRNAVAAEPPVSPTPNRKRMSLAMRKAVGERMRAYWATKRAERQRTSEAADLGTQRAKAAPKRSKARKTLPKGRDSGSEQS
jgi:hypothetical protein